MRPIHVPLLAGAICALAAAPIASSTAAAVPFCGYVEEGAPGPADNVLQIAAASGNGTPSDPALVLTRIGDALELRAGGEPVDCAGADATVINVDLISVAVTYGGFGIDLADGPVGPGATDEGDGSSEIEIEVEGRGEELGTVRIAGTAQADRFEIGRLGRGQVVNLDPSEAVKDRDIELTRGTRLLVDGRGGDDTADAGGGSSFADPAPGPTDLAGGPGDDVLMGGSDVAGLHGDAGDDQLVASSRNGFLYGGPGDDRLTGGSGFDVAFGGRGRDVIRTKAATDQIFARDGDRDTIDCGRQPDSVESLDYRDRLRKCEWIARRGTGLRTPSEVPD